MTAQLNAIGAVPGVADLLVGSLMYSTVAEVTEVVIHVRDDDLDWPLSTILAAVRRLAATGVTPSPQLVYDELGRAGKPDQRVLSTLANVATSGACSSAARHYAAAVVAEALRQRAESAGRALTSAANNAAEAELSPMVDTAAASMADCADRLAALRGEAL